MIGMEVLSRLIYKALEGSFLFGCKTEGRGEEELIISHLLYVDDTFLFYNANSDHMVYLSWILMWFKVVSGLRINLDKTEISPAGGIKNVEELNSELG